MKPAPFAYHAPHTIEEAIALAREHGEDARFLAGGQSLVPIMNARLAQPAHLIDINRIDGLSGIASESGGLLGRTTNALWIGALTRHHAIETSAEVQTACPILAAAAATVGHLAIRERGTFGGSLAHADPAAQFPLLVALLEGEIESRSADGTRRHAASEFFQSIFTTCLEPGELVTRVRVPALEKHEGWGFRMLSRRSGDFAIAAAAATLKRDRRGHAESLRLGLGGIGATPVILREIAESSRGEQTDEDWIARVANRAVQAAAIEEHPHFSAAYRRALSETLLRRALSDAFDRS